jgi:MFS family permease
MRLEDSEQDFRLEDVARRPDRTGLRGIAVRSAYPFRSLERARRALPENVRRLGWVSFANDAASELMYPVVPLFLTVTLGAPVVVVGVIEGIAEGIANGLRGIAGWLSDRAGERRLPWIFGGYGASALARPVIAAAPAWGFVLLGRVVDRLGKAGRTAPRDALIRDSTPPELTGASFGYHRAMDSAGAVVGPLIAVALLAAGVSLRTVLWVAVVPGLFTIVLLRGVREAPPRAQPETIEPEEAARLPAAFWYATAVWTVFSLGNSADVFLLLRAHNLGLSVTAAVLAYALYQACYAGLSWPFGALSDRLPRRFVLAAGLGVFALVYLGFALTTRAWTVWPLFAVYGVYIAATDGVAKAWVADRLGGRPAGTAFGVFAAATGVAALAASIAAGLLWSHVSHAAPFVLGAAGAALALPLVLFAR